MTALSLRQAQPPAVSRWEGQKLPKPGWRPAAQHPFPGVGGAAESRGQLRFDGNMSPCECPSCLLNKQGNRGGWEKQAGAPRSCSESPPSTLGLPRAALYRGEHTQGHKAKQHKTSERERSLFQTAFCLGNGLCSLQPAMLPRPWAEHRLASPRQPRELFK